MPRVRSRVHDQSMQLYARFVTPPVMMSPLGQ